MRKHIVAIVACLGLALGLNTSALAQRHNHNDGGDSWGEVGGFLGGLIEGASKADWGNHNDNHHDNHHRHHNDDYDDGNYYYPQQQQQQYYYQQPAAPVAPVAQPVPVAPVKANIAKAIKKPKKNAKVAFKKGDIDKIAEKLAGKSANEARDIANKLNEAITAAVSDLANNEAKAAWADVLRNGSRPDDLAAFKAAFGGELGGGVADMLMLRGGVAGFLQAMNNGALTPGGQSQAIASLLGQAKGLPAGPMQDALIASLNGITVYIDLVKLVGLTGGSHDSLDVIYVGFQNAGLPPGMLCELTGMPLMAGPYPNKATRIDDNAVIYIYCPQDCPADINYNLGNSPFSMNPGQGQWLNKSYVIRFDSGAGGEKKYTLSSGTYRWSLGDQGWNLQKVKVNVSVDNSIYEGPFNYLVDGKDAALQPGEAADLTSDLPIVLEFDYGDGMAPAYKVLTGGKFMVGVDMAKERLDLFDAIVHADLIASISGSVGGDGMPLGAAARDEAIQETLTRLKAAGN